MRNSRQLVNIAIFGVCCLVGFAQSASAGEVTINWDPNSESDLAGYYIYYGTSSRDYNTTLWVGNQTSYQVSGLQGGQRYYFAVTAIDHSGNESNFSREVSAIIPQQDEDDEPDDQPPDDQPTDSAPLMQVYNFPNPFQVRNENTRIRYELQNDAEVTIEILDVNMNVVKTLIKNEFKAQGEHIEDVWDGTNASGNYVSNGVYFCNIRTPDHQEVIKIAVTR